MTTSAVYVSKASHESDLNIYVKPGRQSEIVSRRCAELKIEYCLQKHPAAQQMQ
jgi:3-deoxy-D-manno-octulosonate 8-phosphate phosphatase KdsC-like HAD superfamily phosphatase